MFSLIITIISVALVAALALATLYYGGDAFNQGTAKAQAAKVQNQGQQLLGAAELFYSNQGRWPTDIPELVSSSYLKTAPVAMGAVTAALAENSWTMPLAEEPVFLLDGMSADACAQVNATAYGMAGVLFGVQPGYQTQCYGPDLAHLSTVVARSPTHLANVAAFPDSAIPASDVRTDGLPTPAQTDQWLVVPGTGTVTGGGPATVEPGVAALSVSGAATDFGAVANHTTALASLTLTNTGTADLTLLATPALTGSPAYSITTTTCGALLAPAASCEVALAFAPTTLTTESATLSVSSNVQEMDVAITGSAYNPVSLAAATLPEAKLNKVYAAVDFAAQLAVSNEASPSLGQVAWATSGTLPAGLTFDTSTAQLSGTPTALTTGTGAAFTVVATYKGNDGTQMYTIKVGGTSLTALAVSAGSRHACAITPSKGVVCWGDNTNGQLGNGSVTASAAPVAVASLSSVESLTSGALFTCARTTGGGAYCWGKGTNGQMGVGTKADTNATPVQPTGLNENVTSLTAGLSNVCALVGGGVKCWGLNSTGQVGDGGPTDVTTPKAVASLSSNVVAVHAAPLGYAVCALTSTDSVRCWGAVGQFGLSGYSVQEVVAPGQSISSFAVGGTSVSATLCVIKSGGAVGCLGANSTGIFGNGTTNASPSIMQTASLPGAAAQIAMGGSHACATVGGGLYCWGFNSKGQVGNNTQSSALSPVPVVDAAGAPLTGVSQFSLGTTNTCAVVSGVAKCWGDNTYGQVGDRTTTLAKSAVDVLE